MSERKVLNKYYPPDFDPSKIPRLRKPKDVQEKVRLMAPFSMRCLTCNEYIAKGKKFNARKETAQGEDYLGLKIFRFYIRCPRCSAEITFKTDPQNADYKCEFGALRNFDPWREGRLQEKEEEEEEERERELDPMRALERRTEESKREMDILDALDEIRIRNARNERLDQNEIIDRMLGETPEEKLRREEEEIERLAREAFAKKPIIPFDQENSSEDKKTSDEYADVEDEEALGTGPKLKTSESTNRKRVAQDEIVRIAAQSLGISLESTLSNHSSKPKSNTTLSLGIVKRARTEKSNTNVSTTKTTSKPDSNNVLSSLCAYGSGSDEETSE
jgi:hypothetical protein